MEDAAKKKPKRPMSAYNYFFKEQRQLIEAEATAGVRKKVGFQEMGKIIGKRWKSISSEDAKPYKAKAVVDSARYKTEMAVHYKAEVAAICNGGQSNAHSKTNDATKTLTQSSLHNAVPGGPLELASSNVLAMNASLSAAIVPSMTLAPQEPQSVPNDSNHPMASQMVEPSTMAVPSRTLPLALVQQLLLLQYAQNHQRDLLVTAQHRQEASRLAQQQQEQQQQNQQQANISALRQALESVAGTTLTSAPQQLPVTLGLQEETQQQQMGTPSQQGQQGQQLSSFLQQTSLLQQNQQQIALQQLVQLQQNQQQTTLQNALQQLLPSMQQQVLLHPTFSSSAPSVETALNLTVSPPSNNTDIGINQHPELNAAQLALLMQLLARQQQR